MNIISEVRGDIPPGQQPEVSAIEPTLPSSVPHDRRRIATNFLAMTLSSILTVLVGMFTTIYSRRLLGPIAVGQVNWNAAVLAYLGLIANPGMQTIGQRHLATDATDTARLTSLILSLQMIFALGAYAVVIGLAALDLRGPQVSALLLLQGITLLITAFNVGWVLQAHERMVAPAVIALIINLLQIPALIALVHGPGDVHAFVLYTMPFALLGMAFNFWYLQRHGLLRLRELRFRLKGGRQLLSESWPLALSQGATLLYYNCDAIILGFTSGDATVGLYTTAYKLMLLSTVVSGPMWNAYFPALSRSQGDPLQARRIASEFTTLLAWMGFPMAALGWACGRHVVVLMLGAPYAESGIYFEWLCLNIALVFFNTGIGLPLLTWGYQRTQFKIAATAGIVNLLLNLVLIPRYGAWGAVATTLGAEAMVMVLTLRARRRIGLGWSSPLALIAAPAVSSLVVALSIRALGDALAGFWWLELALGILALGGCLLVFERRILATVLKLLQRR